MFDETSAYYLVGFEPSRADDRFHRVRIRVDRPDATVKTRTGYYARRAGSVPSPGAAGGVTPVERALAGSLPAAGLSMSAVALARPVASQPTAEVTVVTRVDMPPASHPGATDVDILAAAFDNGWTQRALDRRTVEVSRPPRAPNAPAEIRSTMRLRPGHYELRIAAEVESRAGSVYLDLNVPDFERDPLSLAGPLITIDQTIGAISTPPEPTARRTFARHESVTVITQAWEGRGGTDPIAASARVGDAAGRTVWRQDAVLSKGAPGTSQSAVHSVALPLDQLAPGEYVFTIELARGSHVLQRHVRFTVQ
jgi:hypothetical protein